MARSIWPDLSSRLLERHYPTAHEQLPLSAEEPVARCASPRASSIELVALHSDFDRLGPAVSVSFQSHVPGKQLDTCLRRAAFRQDVACSLQVASLWIRRKAYWASGASKKFLPPLMSEGIRATVAARYCTRKPSAVRIDVDYHIAILVSSRLTRVGGRP